MPASAGPVTSGHASGPGSRTRTAAGSRGGRMPELAQLTLFCPTCCGALVVVGSVRNHDGDLVAVPQLCPTCRPRSAAPGTWLATVRLAERLAAGAQR